MFDHVEEYLMLYGLPPTENVDSLKSKIVYSITPFVKKVLEVSPCLHKGATQDDFFAGKYDGNWRMKVIPRNRKSIPNFIVVGNGVMGKEMCTVCYRTGHFRRNCPGGRNWSDYCKEFGEEWDYLVDNVEEEEEEINLNGEDDYNIVERL